MSDETCGWRRDESFLPCGLPPGHEGGHRPAITKPTTCGWCWGTHGCDLPAGHLGDHLCRIEEVTEAHDGTEITVLVTCDRRPQGHLDLFHMHWGERRGIEYLDPVKQAESDRIYARMRFTETPTTKRPDAGRIPRAAPRSRQESRKPPRRTPMTIDPDRACPHEDFAADVDVNRLGDGAHGQPGNIIGYSAEIRIRCADCGEPFRWIGVPAGMHPRHPACSPDETELRAPIRPASSDPDFGMGLPGFAIRMVGPPEDYSATDRMTE